MVKPLNSSFWGKRLVPKLTCPNCWHRFFPEECLFISRHPDLIGDPTAGPNEYLRFLATRFNVKGEALDELGMPATDLACPRCHLQIADPLLEVAPMFISMVGSPASGKSYFLTTMTWELRRILPQAMLSFSDADPVANSAVHDYEQTLFMNPRPDQPTEIRKTQTDDPRLHRTALLNGAPMRFPTPLQFLLWPAPEHPRYARGHQIGRIVILYDNAGEDYLPGADSGASAAIQHLASSQILFVLFDPTQDVRFRTRCHSDDPQLSHGLRPGAVGGPVLLRQETLLREAAVRVRRYMSVPQDARLRKPLVVVLPKADVWANLARVELDREPYVGGQDGTPLRVDLAHVEQTSDRIRELLRQLCPELVATAEGLSEVVRYVPISSLGRSPTLVRRGEHDFYGIAPRDIQPKWVTVPLLYCLSRWTTGIIPSRNGHMQETRRAHE